MTNANKIGASIGNVLDLKPEYTFLKKLLPAKGVPALFNNTLDVGWMKRPDGLYLILLNKNEESKKIDVSLPATYQFTNYFTDEKKGTFKNNFIEELPAHSGRVYKLMAL